MKIKLSSKYLCINSFEESFLALVCVFLRKHGCKHDIAEPLGFQSTIASFGNFGEILT
jgi:hypothetical protein